MNSTHWQKLQCKVFGKRIFRNSKTTGLLGLEFLNCFKNDPKALSISADNLTYNSTLCVKAFPLLLSQTHMKEYGNSPEYLLQGARKTFVNVFHHRVDEILTGLLVGEKKRGREQLFCPRARKEHIKMGAFSPFHSWKH